MIKRRSTPYNHLRFEGAKILHRLKLIKHNKLYFRFRKRNIIHSVSSNPISCTFAAFQFSFNTNTWSIILKRYKLIWKMTHTIQNIKGIQKHIGRYYHQDNYSHIISVLLSHLSKYTIDKDNLRWASNEIFFLRLYGKIKKMHVWFHSHKLVWSTQLNFAATMSCTS